MKGQLMSLADPMAITYNAVVKNLVRTRFDNYSSEYQLKDPANDLTFDVKVSHTLPNSEGTKESHSIKLDVSETDATTGLPVVTSSAWLTFKTFLGAQPADATHVMQALVDYLTDANVDKILARES